MTGQLINLPAGFRQVNLIKEAIQEVRTHLPPLFLQMFAGIDLPIPPPPPFRRLKSKDQRLYLREVSPLLLVARSLDGWTSEWSAELLALGRATVQIYEAIQTKHPFYTQASTKWKVCPFSPPPPSFRLSGRRVVS